MKRAAEGSSSSLLAAVLLMFAAIACDGDSAVPGVYDLAIVKDGAAYDVRGNKPPRGAPYEAFNGRVTWRFTNETPDRLELWISNFECNNVPVSQCPVSISPGGTEGCSSARIPLEAGTTQPRDIVAVDNGGTCPRDGENDVHLWHFNLNVRGDGPTQQIDPELQIDRDTRRSRRPLWLAALLGAGIGLAGWWLWRRRVRPTH
jgi:hypothetical protein